MDLDKTLDPNNTLTTNQRLVKMRLYQKYPRKPTKQEQEKFMDAQLQNDLEEEFQKMHGLKDAEDEWKPIN